METFPFKKNPTSTPVKPSTGTELSAEHQLVESLKDDKPSRKTSNAK